jgi:hypothetical protein
MSLIRRVIAMRIGDHEVPPDEARALVCRYARDHTATVLYYDLGGDLDGHPGPAGAAEPVDQVSLADIGRLVIIDARLNAADAPVLLNAAAPALFEAVPARARLEEWTPGGPLDQAATALYDQFRTAGIGGAKRSKLLHLKRPWLVPIYDTRLHEVYKQRVAALTAEIDDPNSAWWEAPKRDLVEGANELAALMASLAADGDAVIRRAGHLTALRLLDIIAWQLGA